MATATEPMTIEEFAQLPSDGIPRELVEGIVVEMNTPKPRHGQVAFRAAYLIQSHIEGKNLGHVCTNDSGVIIRRNPDTLRGADVSFYSFDRVPPGPFPTTYLDESPNLVIEVKSDSNTWSELLSKGAEYLSVNVEVVLILDPDTRTARVLYPDKPFLVFESDEKLVFQSVFPNWEVPVSTFFE